MRRLIILAVVVLLLSSVTLIPIMAQESPTCGRLIEDALDLTNTNCGELSRNQICYGNVELEAEPQEGVTDFNFDEPGDVVPVSAVRNLTLTSILDETRVWGIALMRLQANLPDALPGQNVTFLLFGDVQLTDAVSADSEAEATPEADTGDAAPLTTMQAFYFTSSVGNVICQEAPESGILVQTPQGVGQINLVANEVNITLGSTAYLQAQPSGDMTVSVVEGQGEISAFNVTVIVPEGYRTTIPLDANGLASAVPTEPEPYDAAALANLPIRILPRTITIAAPEATDEPSAGGGVPIPGEYEFVLGAGSDIGCADPVSAEMAPFMVPPNPVFRLEGDEFDFSGMMETAYGQPAPANAVSVRASPNTYTIDYNLNGADFHYDATIADDGLSLTGQYSFTVAGCTTAFAFTVSRIGD